MAKARRRKESSFEPEQVKSVFLFGHPNKEKLVILQTESGKAHGFNRGMKAFFILLFLCIFLLKTYTKRCKINI